MAPSPSHFFLSVLISLFLLITSHFSFAKTKENNTLNFHSSSNLTSPKDQARKFIRSLNLSPKHYYINQKSPQGNKDQIGTSRIVEKSFKFPYLEEVFDATNNPDLGHHAGYYKIPNTEDARMFYYFFESRNSKSDPAVIWLTGGPGCSGSLALFYENGPFHITSNLSLQWNAFGWDKVSNLIYVDQPTGTGFSYSSSENDIRHDEKGISNDLYGFLQAFFKEHPDYAKNDFYITGESYAGHYIPAFAARVQQGNKNKEGIYINLKGMAIGNGLTNPGIQLPTDADYALSTKLINQSVYNDLKSTVSECRQAANLCGTNGNDTCLDAFKICSQIFREIIYNNDHINYYDIRKKCERELCYDFSLVEKYLNEDSIKKILGVGNRDFVSCNPDVSDAMEQDIMRNLDVEIPGLLEDGIKLLVYVGEYDLTCNWLGNSKWVRAMKWSGQEEFLAAQTIPFSVDGVEAGLLQANGPLSFLKVHNAGHLVPLDQPGPALRMIGTWMQGKLASN